MNTMNNMTPEQIIEKRSEIARLLCARNIFINDFPNCQKIVITEDDLKNVPEDMLADMIAKITPS